MPDNKQGEWTDDAAFYDEAWADMSARLDRRRRRRALPWWLTAGAGALLLVAALWFGTVWKAEPTRAAGKEIATDVPGGERSPVSTAGQTAPEETRSAVTVPPHPSLRKTSPTPAPTPVTTPAAAGPNGSWVAARPRRFVRPPRPVVRLAVPPPTGLLPVVPPPLTRSALLRSPFVAPARFPAPVMPSASRFTLAVEAQTFWARSAGVGIGLKAGWDLTDRWGLTLTTRARYDRLAFTERRVPPTEIIEIADTSGVGPVGAEVPAEVLELRTFGLELAAGLTYRFTPRLAVGAEVGLAYLTAGTLRFRTAPAGGQLSEHFRADLSLFNDQSARAFDLLGLTNSTTARDALPRFDAWQARLGGQVSYRLTPRLGLTAGYARLLAQPDRRGNLLTQRGQGTVGLRYRIR